MQWVAPSEKDSATDTLEKRLWDAADQFRANSVLSAAQYSQPVLGLIFLRFAEVRFSKQRAALEKTASSSRRGSRVDDASAYHAEGILFLPANTRFDYLLNLPERSDIGAKVNDAMRDIEKQNPQLAGVLPKTYNLFTSTLLKELLKKVAKQLLANLKGLLVLDWRKRQTSQARVRDAIKDLLDAGLPRAYTPELYNQKCSSVFEHIYECYPQSGERVYAGGNN